MNSLIKYLLFFLMFQTVFAYSAPFSSISENNGINLLSDQDLRVYSIGISTGGVAEIRMAELNEDRQVIATTLDSLGANFAKEKIEESGFANQIEVKIEDISKPLDYENETFDYVYARLVLHYLNKADLKGALDEIYRVLKPQGKLFVVVRSKECAEASSKNSIIDSITGLTLYTSDEGASYSRYFHSEESIQDHLIESGLTVKDIQSFPEQLCIDFQRTKLSKYIDHLIQVVATK